MADWNARVQAPKTTPLIRSHGEGWRPCSYGSDHLHSRLHLHWPAVTPVGWGVVGEATCGLPANAVDFVLSSIGRQAIWLSKVDFQACAGRRTEI